MMKIEAFDRLIMVFNHIKNNKNDENDVYSNSTNDGKYHITFYRYKCDGEMKIDFHSSELHVCLENVEENDIWLNDSGERVFFQTIDGFFTVPIEIIDQLV